MQAIGKLWFINFFVQLNYYSESHQGRDGKWRTSLSLVLLRLEAGESNVVSDCASLFDLGPERCCGGCWGLRMVSPGLRIIEAVREWEDSIAYSDKRDTLAVLGLARDSSRETPRLVATTVAAVDPPGSVGLAPGLLLENE